MSKEFSEDTFFNGRLSVRQHKKSYRFSIDAVLVAAYAGPASGDCVVDLGAGCGIISLILAFRNPKIRIVGVEIQKELSEIADQNVRENHMEDRVCIIRKDMKSINQNMISGPADLVVSNPPYRKAITGRINSDSRRALARHEIAITLQDIIKTANRLLKTMGRFVMIYPAWRMTDTLACMRDLKIEPKKIRTVHSRQGDEAKLIIVEGIKGGRSGIIVEKPLYIYHNANHYSAEVDDMFLP